MYHVAGPQFPNVNIGASGAYAPVGVCEDGTDLTFRVYEHSIKFDGAGGPEGAEAENIFLNMTVDVRFSLVPYGGTYINRLRAIAGASDLDTDGIMPSPGTLYGMNNLLAGLQFPTTFDPDGGYQFNFCRVSQLGDNKISNTESKPVFLFRCFNFINPTLYQTILGRVLYERI